MNNIDIMNFWLEGSDIDYDTMNMLFTNGKYTWSLFVGHLVLEKLLKAVYVKYNPDNLYAPKSHDLYYLASKSGIEVSDENKIILDEISDFNLACRYGDYKNKFYDICNKEYAKYYINKINYIRNWLIAILNMGEGKECNEG